MDLTIMYCSCCGEQFKETRWCSDCKRKTKPGPRPPDFLKKCDCDKNMLSQLPK